MKKINYVVSLILLFSCSSNEKVSILNDNFINGIGIYLLNNDSLDLKVINELAKSKFSDFNKTDSLNDTVADNLFVIKLEKPSENNTPPNVTSLEYFGKDLTDQEKDKLQNYKQVLTIYFKGTPQNLYAKQQRINKFIKDLIRDKEIVVADYNSYEWFNSASWAKQRVDNFKDNTIDITHQISVHTYRENEYCRAVTMGMNKFCLPDISINNFPCSNQLTFGGLVNAVIQTLAENPVINEDSTLTIDLKEIKNTVVKNFLTSDLKKNAKAYVTIKLKSVEPEEGDNDNKQLLISFENPKYANQQQEQEEIIVNLFGSSDDLVKVTHDALLLNTSKKARQRLPELMKLFNDGLAPGSSILVKVQFKTIEGGNEWMWVEITKWESQSMTGILQNDPFEVKDLKAGSIVNINEDDIFDYIFYHPDGTFEGNETGKILENQQ